MWAKKRGCKIFDFEGIYDERFPNKSWLGFTHFKKSFGGYEVSYPGTYTKTRLEVGQYLLGAKFFLRRLLFTGFAIGLCLNKDFPEPPKSNPIPPADPINVRVGVSKTLI